MLILIIPIALVFLWLSDVHAKETYRVCKSGCPYTTIKQAIWENKGNGEIIVEKGIYQENELIITHPLTLKGMPGAIIDGAFKGPIITIVKAKDVQIEGFTIKNTGKSYIEEIAGIKVIESTNCQIENNHLLETTYGIYLDNSHGCTIRHNIIKGTTESESSGGNGIHVWYGEGQKISDNVISGHRDGIYLEFSKKSAIWNNKCALNLRYGLHFMSSHETSYENNVFTENGAGVAIMYSHKIKMKHNKFTLNKGPAAYGLLLKEISDSFIEDNEFSQNTVGIFMEGATRSRFLNNDVKDNGWGIKLTGSCDSDTFEHNNFMGNTFDLSTNTMANANDFSKNYWSSYDGYDLDHDGIGDTPFRPVSLSSIIVEKIDASYLLLKSFMFKLIDDIERALPELIPERLNDPSPLMNPIERNKA